MKKSLASLAILAALGVLLTVTPAKADTIPVDYQFACIAPTNTSNCGTVAEQMLLQVSSIDPTHIVFEFFNAKSPYLDPVNSTITKVYWDMGLANLLTSMGTITSSSGVTFTAASKLGTLPGGNNLTPAFTVDFEADQSGRGITNGVNPGEWLKVPFLVPSSEDVFAALDSGDLRVGMHVQAISPSGLSDAMVTETETPVPEPASMLLLGTGLLGAGFAARRRKN